MLRLIASLCVVLMLQACSWKDVIGLVSPSKGGIDTEIVLGNKKQEVITSIGTQKATTIINKEEAPPWLMVLAAIGWFLPSPQGLFRMWRSRNDKQ